MKKALSNNINKASISLCLILAITGCCSGKSTTDQSAKPVSNTAKATGVATPMATALMKVTPTALRECESTKGIGVPVIISWDASATSAQSVKIWVQGPGSERKLWIEGGATGREKTGSWTVPGTVFTLTDSDGKQLTQLTMSSGPCG